MPEKICSMCHEEKDISQFHRNRKRKDGYRYECKACSKKESSRHYFAHKPYIQKHTREYRATHKDLYKSKKRAWDDSNQEHIREYTHNYYYANIATILEKARIRYWENPELSRQKTRQFRLDNPAYSRTYYEINKEALRIQRALFYQKHPEKARKKRMIRRARLRNAPRIEAIDHEEIAARDKWTCHICHKRVNRKNWSIDHLVPLIDNGSHTMDNVALAHRRCNSKRGAWHTIPVQLRLY